MSLIPLYLFLERWERQLQWDPEVVASLQAMNYQVEEDGTHCVVQLVHCEHFMLSSNGTYASTLTAVSDPRKAGWPAGF